jgi:SAM-dependent methyltransferase
MDKDFTTPINALYENQMNHPKARRNQVETIRLIDENCIFKGNILDIGERNLFTEILENTYGVTIESTYGDLDVEFKTLEDHLYDFIHYNNVIEHQFNPLFTLLKIKERLKPDGILVLGCPIKPSWITFSKCHFHEFDQYRFDKLIARAGFKVVDYVKFWRQVRFNGLRPFLGSFHRCQGIYLLKKT